ncbi:MAG TPA: DUF2784 family protein, partial [bacterium]|nr:DUF2784 family protein [bacterium]
MLNAYLYLLDYGFTALHISLIFFNLFGWIFKRLRKYNLICILLTLGSWIILGFWYGLGYCPLTDWHFKVLEKLGYQNLPKSYIKYLADRLTGISWNEKIIDIITCASLVIALVCSIYTNIKLG